MNDKTCIGVREYCEGYQVEIVTISPNRYNELKESRLAIFAENEGGFNSTAVDLLQLIEWLKINMPEVMK